MSAVVNIESQLMQWRQSKQQKSVSDFNKGEISRRVAVWLLMPLRVPIARLSTGTNHAAENITGFLQKFGDGGADTPFIRLNKRQETTLRNLVRLSSFARKIPTADLKKTNLCRRSSLGSHLRTGIDDYLEASISQAQTQLSEALVAKGQAWPPPTNYRLWWLWGKSLSGVLASPWNKKWELVLWIFAEPGNESRKVRGPLARPKLRKRSNIAWKQSVLQMLQTDRSILRVQSDGSHVSRIELRLLWGI